MIRTLVPMIVLAGLGSVVTALALTPLAGIDFSPETTVSIDALLVADEDVVTDDFGGGVLPRDLGALSDVEAISAYHRLPSGDQLISLESWAELGGIRVGPGDVVRIDLADTVSLEIDGSLIGVPDGVGIDALTIDGEDALLSFDVTVELGGTAFADEDLIRWDGGSFASVFDGSAQGVDPALDLDGAHLLENGHLLLSFDGSASVGGFPSRGEDVLEYSAGPVWELAYDGSVERPALADTDLDAIFADVFLVQVSLSGNGSGAISSDDGIDCGADCEEIVVPEASLSLEAAPNAGSAFTGWTGAPCGLSTACTFTVDGDRTVDGRFTLAGDVVFLDGFETGDAGEWSSASP